MRKYRDKNMEYTNLVDIYNAKYKEDSDIMDRKKYKETYDELSYNSIKESDYTYYDNGTMTKYKYDNLWFCKKIKTCCINSKEDIENEIEKLEHKLKNINDLNNKIQVLTEIYDLKGRLNKFKYDDDDENEVDLYEDWDECCEDNNYEITRYNISPQHQYELDYEGDTYDCEGGDYDQDLYE